MLIHITYMVKRHNRGCKTFACIMWIAFTYIDSETNYDIDYVQVFEAIYYTQYIRKTIQIMYYIGKSTFKLIKFLINLNTADKYKPVNDKNDE